MTYLPSNRALLDRFRAGDRRALHEVYAHYAPGLARVLRASLSSRLRGGCAPPLELADAVQEVFARSFSEAGRLSYDGVKPFAAYLSGVAHNVVVDQLRRRQTAVDAQQTLAQAAQDGHGEAPPDLAAEEAEVGRLVASFIGGLEEQARGLYRVRYSEGRTQEDAARALGLSRIQVRRAELRFRRALLLHLKQHGYLEDVRLKGWGVAKPNTPGKQRGP
ncbi:MAG: RNA polymerase sigma factor [Myxococcaceae bacterium]